MRIVTKTSAQAKQEEQEEKNSLDDVCPECNVRTNPGVRVKKIKGFIRTVHMEKQLFECKCGCQWHTDWKVT